MSRKKTPYIHDQVVRLLCCAAADDPRKHLQPEQFRAVRMEGESHSENTQDDVWVKVDRAAVAGGEVWLEGQSQGMAGPKQVSLHRLAMVCDAGMGKTTTMEWLERECNQPATGKLALLIKLSDITQEPADFVRDVLLEKLQRAPNNGVEGLGEAQKTRLVDVQLRMLRRLRDQGRIVLLFDALDQASMAAVMTLQKIVGSPQWRACRIVVSARPHALHRHENWRDIFGTHSADWQFAKLDEFTEWRARQFLGETEAGNNRYDLIPREARLLLTVPRVLSYLYDLPDADFASIRTASDVFWKCVDHLIRERLQAEQARPLGLPAGSNPPHVQEQSVALARKLLAAMAYEMFRNGGNPAEGARHRPNFGRVAHGQIEGFLSQVYDRVKSPRYEGNYPRFEADIGCLEAMNAFVSHGFLDVDKLDQLLWRDRSLQEWFAAYWLANYCTGSDAEEISHWLHLADDQASNEYYPLWLYATEMPLVARDAECWARAMAPLYKPGNGTRVGTWRSTEMIYRSWQSLESARRDYSEQGHRPGSSVTNEQDALKEFHRQSLEQFQKQCLAPYQSEFVSEILSGHRDRQLNDGKCRRRIAEEFMNGFRLCPPPKDDGSPGDLTFWFGSPISESGRMSNELIQHETSIHGPFELSEFPVTKGLYELYDRNNNVSYDSYLRSPVVGVSRYEAFAFCLWLGVRYRLPTEKEWEFACRAGTRTAYWFSDEVEQLAQHAYWDPNANLFYCNDMDVPQPFDRSLVSHRNPWGLYDMHGNVWEWCADWHDSDAYRPESYKPPWHERRRVRGEIPHPGGVARGGTTAAFSTFLRCAARAIVHSDEFSAFSRFSFRVARTFAP